MTHPPNLTLVPKFDLPPTELVEQLGLDPADMGDFFLCLKIVQLEMQRVRFSAACAQVGVAHQNFASARWQKLMNKALAFVAGPLLTEVRNTTAQAFEAWPDLVASLVNVGINGGRDHEKVQAIELFYNIFIAPQTQVAQDDQAGVDYLKKIKNFDPQSPMHLIQPIQVNEGGTVIIQTGEKDETRS